MILKCIYLIDSRKFQNCGHYVSYVQQVTRIKNRKDVSCFIPSVTVSFLHVCILCCQTFKLG